MLTFIKIQNQLHVDREQNVDENDISQIFKE